MEITDTTTPKPPTAEYLQNLEIELSRTEGFGAVLSDFDPDDIDYAAAELTPAEAAAWLTAGQD